MMIEVIWFLIGISTSSYSAPSTLATFNEKEACVKVANDLRKISGVGSGGGIVTYCVSAPASTVVRK